MNTLRFDMSLLIMLLATACSDKNEDGDIPCNSLTPIPIYHATSYANNEEQVLEYYPSEEVTWFIAAVGSTTVKPVNAINSENFFALGDYGSQPYGQWHEYYPKTQIDDSKLEFIEKIEYGDVDDSKDVVTRIKCKDYEVWREDGKLFIRLERNDTGVERLILVNLSPASDHMSTCITLVQTNTPDEVDPYANLDHLTWEWR